MSFYELAVWLSWILTVDKKLICRHICAHAVHWMHNKQSQMTGVCSTLGEYQPSGAISPMHNAHCTMHIAQCKMYIAQCTIQIAQCTMLISQCTSHLAPWKLTPAQCTMRIAQLVIILAEVFASRKVNHAKGTSENSSKSRILKIVL